MDALPGEFAETVVVALHRKAATVCEAELRRLATRVPELDARAREEVGRAIDSVVAAFFHDATLRLAKDARHAEALGVLFALDALGGRS